MAGLTGFIRNAFMPAAIAACSSLAPVRPEMPMTGTGRGVPAQRPNRRVAARPSMTGSVTSINTRSYPPLSTAATAASAGASEIDPVAEFRQDRVETTRA